MKLSELVDERLKAEATENGEGLAALSSTVYGVEIDDEFVSFDPPPGITEIGLVARFADGDFKDEVLDLATSYQMAVSRPSVLLEIPAEEDIGSVRHVVSTIENLKASASFLPPEDLTDENFETYCQRLEAVAAEWASRSGFAEMLLPITSYFQHMVVELLDPALGQSFVPDDEYVIDRFHSRIPVEKSDAMKARLRTVIRAAFTDDAGVNRFDETMLVLCNRQLGDIEKVAAELAENQAAHMAALAAAEPENKTPKNGPSRKKAPGAAKNKAKAPKQRKPSPRKPVSE